MTQESWAKHFRRRSQRSRWCAGEEAGCPPAKCIESSCQSVVVHSAAVVSIRRQGRRRSSLRLRSSVQRRSTFSTSNSGANTRNNAGGNLFPNSDAGSRRLEQSNSMQEQESLFQVPLFPEKRLQEVEELALRLLPAREELLFAN